MKTLLERFLTYVKIDTQSQPDVDKVPSTDKQLVLSKLLFDELNQMGASEVKMDDHGYVYATIPANTDSKYTLGLIAHVDTSDAVSGKNVNPQIVANYDGGDIKLNDQYTLSPKQFPELATHKGKTLITTDGTTLLGADDKAGIAAIMYLADFLLHDNSTKHGKIRIGFTPDEEVGRGTDFFDVAGFACDGAYTIDGERLGMIMYENFNAAEAKLYAFGKSVHPGTAKNAMVNANLLLMEFNALLPEFDKPQYTQFYEGFYHIDKMSGTVDNASATYIIRDHDKQKFQNKKDFFVKCVEHLNTKYGFEALKCTVTDSYYNMKEVLVNHMYLVDKAIEAMKMADVKPLVVPIRGGTDGARLSFEGLPCPNLFTGAYNFHGRFEYIPQEDFEKLVEVLKNLVTLYA